MNDIISYCDLEQCYYSEAECSNLIQYCVFHTDTNAYTESRWIT